MLGKQLQEVIGIYKIYVLYTSKNRAMAFIAAGDTSVIVALFSRDLSTIRAQFSPGGGAVLGLSGPNSGGLEPTKKNLEPSETAAWLAKEIIYCLFVLIMNCDI